MSVIVINNFITQASSTLKSGLIGYWALDEASGTRSDSHSNGLDLTDNNTVGQGTGNVYANCADLEKSNSEYLSHADDSLFSPSSLTVSLWVKLESQPSNNTGYIIASKDDYASTSNREFALSYENSAGSIRVVLYFLYGASFSTAVSTFGALSNGTWYLVTFRHDQGTQIDVSINAGTVDSTSLNQTMNNGTAPFALGAHYNSGRAESYYDGLMGPAAMWDRALSDSEVSEFYNSGSGKEYSEL